MDLKSGYPFWTVKNGLLNAFPALRENIDCDVLVVGAGITGALIAWHLQLDGHRVAVIDRREAGWGSSAASTALLQYEIDTPMEELAERYGEADAALAYGSCAHAIGALGTIARRLRGVGFRSTRSLYYASHWYHRARLRREAALRQRHGFALRLLDGEELRRRYGLDAPLAILTELAAVVDPYRMAHRLFATVVRKGGRVFDRTEMARFTPRGRDVLVETTSGQRIRAGRLVIASGYESQSFLDERVARNRSSYAFVTDPIEPGQGFMRDCVVWESARPYLYARPTTDGRILVGGEDDTIDIPARRDAAVLRKSRTLAKKFSARFPQFDVQPAFAWAGTFAETEDGLPFFGAHAQHGPRVHFAMAYGGNGISYSLIGAELLRARFAGRSHPCEALFSFQRLRR